MAERGLVAAAVHGLSPCPGCSDWQRPRLLWAGWVTHRVRGWRRASAAAEWPARRMIGQRGG